MSRQSKKIEISLQAPEFSAYFDNKDIDEYTVGKTYNCKDIEEPGLAKILIEKYLQAAELIAAKLKREDIFDLDKFKSTLLVIKENISLDFLKAVTTELTIKLNADTLSRAIELRENRKKINAPKDKLIRDFRVYGEGLPDKALYPYATQYAEIFLKLLRRNKLMCPKYNHLYIQVVPTFDEGLKNSFAYEDWNVNGIAVIDYTNYQKQSEKKKKETVFNLIVEGLKDIAYIDNLDMSIIDKVIAEIKNE